jgi:transposase
MRKGVTVEVSSADRARLTAIVADRNSRPKHVWRARIVLMTADGVRTNAIMRQTGQSNVTVWRWQERFMVQGVDGLLRDKTRPAPIAALPAAVRERAVALTLSHPPGESTQWTAGLLAQKLGISVSSVQRICRAHGLQPDRVRQFKLSRDRQFVENLRDVVGLYVDPPADAWCCRSTRNRAKLEVHAVLSHWLIFAILITVVAAYYLFLLSNGTFQLFAPEMLDKAFDNMLVHLLRDEFTVDREAIGYEAFTRGGKTYAYFGIFPAMLRLFAMPFADITQAQLARLSCLTAVVLFVALQLRMLLIVHQSLPAASRRLEFFVVMVVATILSGPQLYILFAAWIYHEPVLWSAAMAAGFNLVIARTTFGTKSLSGRDLVLLAGLAGLAINTRASIGVSLYVGTLLLVVWTTRLRYTSDRPTQQFSSAATRSVSVILPPLTLLGLAGVVVGIINFGRWGNPFAFADFHYWDMRVNWNTIEVLREYGEFNVGRIWIGALYYATDIPYLLHTLPPFAEFLRSRIQVVDAPPMTPILTNPLTIILAGIGLYRVWWKSDLSFQQVTILRLALVGHGAAVFLILAASAYTSRYRFDFTPFMTLAALVGYRSVSIGVAEACEAGRKRAHIFAISLCFLGVLSSHYVLLLHKVYVWAVPIGVRVALLPFAPFAHYVFR